MSTPTQPNNTISSGEKPTHALIADVGHAGVNLELIDLSNGRTKSAYTSYMRAQVTGDSLNLEAGGFQEIDLAWSEWFGRRFVVGDACLTPSVRDNIERHSGQFRYGEEMQRHIIAHVAAAYLGLKKGKIALYVFMPPQWYKDVELRQRALSLLMENAKVCIQLKGDTKPREWQYVSVTVAPECLSGALVAILDAKGNLVKNTLLKSTVILDLGAGTADAVELTNGMVNTELLEFATFDNLGLRQQLFRPMLADVKQQAAVYKALNTDDMERAVRLGLISGVYEVDFGGEVRDIADIYNYHRRRYADVIASNIIDEFYRGFTRHQHGYIHGGGYKIAGDHLQRIFPEKILDFTQFPHMKSVEPVNFNKEGMRRKVLADAKGQGWIK